MKPNMMRRRKKQIATYALIMIACQNTYISRAVINPNKDMHVQSKQRSSIQLVTPHSYTSFQNRTAWHHVNQVEAKIEKDSYG